MTKAHWRGLNKRRAATELADTESPNTSNAFFYKDSTGVLGPRRGRKIASRPAGVAAVASALPHWAGSGRNWIYGTRDGQVGVAPVGDASSPSYQNSGLLLAGATESVALSASFTQASTSDSDTAAFSQSYTSTGREWIVFQTVDLWAQITEDLPFSFSYTMYLGLVVGGSPTYLTAQTLEWTEGGTGKYYQQYRMTPDSIACRVPTAVTATGAAIAVAINGGWPLGATGDISLIVGTVI